MSPEALAIVFGGVGALLSLSMTVPQATTIWRSRSYEGVSIGSWMLLTLTASTWAGFSVRTANVSLGVGNAAFLLACWCIILATLRADGYPFPKSGIVITAGLTAALAAVAAGLWAPLVVVVSGGVAASFVRTPQVAKSFRTWTGTGPSDISLMSLWIGFAGNWCWTLHGVFRADPFVTMAAAIGMLVAGLIIGLEVATHRRRKSAPPRFLEIS